MRIAVGSDHAGFELKGSRWPSSCASRATRCWTWAPTTPIRWTIPISPRRWARPFCDGRADRGVLICGSGVGASVAANKIAGIRAGLCHDTYSAHQGVEHDDMNVLVLGARVVGTALAQELVRPSAGAFTKEERHVRRLEKVRATRGAHESRENQS